MVEGKVSSPDCFAFELVVLLPLLSSVALGTEPRAPLYQPCYILVLVNV